MKRNMKLMALGLASALAASVAVAESKVPETLTKAISELSSIPPTSITETPLKGIYEVLIGGDIVYLDGDANFMFRGELIDLEKRINLTDQTLNNERQKLVSALEDNQTVMYKPKGETKHTITVFTDIDCPYCRKMHEEMDQYLEAGIAVRYALYPRAGVGSPSYDKLVNVWCADDAPQAMTDAKSGKTVEAKTCENPVQSHMELGQMVGVNGTPAILLEGGQLIPGYRPARALAPMLDQLAAAN